MTSSPTRALEALVRLEWVGAALAGLALFGWLGGSWWLFALLILAPDLSMLFYLAGPRAGATAYNAAHTLLGPLAALASELVGFPLGAEIALVWLAHIAADRALGYGLKRSSGFRDTHLGRLGPGETRINPR